MPTENRSSTKMVWFPRELSDDLAELIAHRARVCGGGAFEIWEAICEGFGKPAEQHQGAPVESNPSALFNQLQADITARDEELDRVRTVVTTVRRKACLPSEIETLLDSAIACRNS